MSKINVVLISTLRKLGAETILGGEFEAGLVALVERLAANGHGDHQDPQEEPVISLSRQQFLVPDRSGLPPSSRYAYLTCGPGDRRVVGYTEATRGCKHTCRHCPIVPVYGGKFRVVQRDVVLEDIRRQVEAGARHITFGDPDFFNGPGHAIPIVRALHERWPDLTYDVTIKIEHLLQHSQYLPVLQETGCAFVSLKGYLDLLNLFVDLAIVDNIVTDGCYPVAWGTEISYRH